VRAGEVCDWADARAPSSGALQEPDGTVQPPAKTTTVLLGGLEDEPEGEPEDDPVWRAIRMWEQGLSHPLRTGLRRSILALARRRPLTVASLFSGSGLAERVMQRVQTFWAMELGETLGFQYLFLAELDERKRKFLLEQFPEVQHIFGDVSKLTEQKGWCFKQDLRSAQRGHHEGDTVLNPLPGFSLLTPLKRGPFRQRGPCSILKGPSRCPLCGYVGRRATSLSHRQPS